MNSYYIIDKDSLIELALNNILADYPSLISFGKTSDKEQAMNSILKNKPDLVFFNLDCVFKKPFEFVTELNSLLEVGPEFVAVSSTIDNAYQAIKHSFIDYLTLPISEVEVRKLILKFKKKRISKITRKLCLQSYKDFQYLNTNNILFLKADNNTTDIYINDGSIISAYKTLKVFESTLPNNFLRIHKSYIVNRDFVSRINYGKSRCSVMNSIHKIPFTKTYIDNVEYIKNTLSDISVSSLN